MTAKTKITLALVTGIAFVAVMLQLKPAPEQTDQQAAATPVNAMVVKPRTFRVEVEGYGDIMPAKSWTAVANVGGRITRAHSKLKNGELISQGTELLRIDPTRYELARQAAQSELAVIDADIKQLAQEEENLKALLALDRRRLTLAQKELERAKTMANQGSLSQTRLDEQQRATLQHEQSVQNRNHQLNVIPVKRDTLKARRQKAQTALRNAEEDLKDTRFVAPWDMRLHLSNIETGQYVSPGQTLFVADTIARAEATVQLAMTKLRRVLAQLTPRPFGNGEQSGKSNNLLQHPPLLDDLDVWVAPVSAPDSRWSGKLSRIGSGINPSSRTVQTVITVEEPYRNASPPERPPLVRNMFVRARIAAPTPEPVIVIPASAVHQGVVYLADDDNRLERREVDIAWVQQDKAIIRRGLTKGDRVILNDLVPAIDGMALTLQQTAAVTEPKNADRSQP